MTRSRVVLRTLLALVTAAGLAYDAYVHLDLAHIYDAARTSVLSQGDLFRAQAVAAIAAAVLVIVRPRRYTALVALAVSASAFGAVLLYRYVDVGRLGPIPSMYEPVWYPEKTHATWAEGIATVTSIALFALLHLTRRRDARERIAVPAKPTADVRADS